jgi:Hypothetical glycosyl hydrolase family 15
MDKGMQVGLAAVLVIAACLMIIVPRSNHLAVAPSWAQVGSFKTLTQLPALPDISLWTRMLKPRGEIGQAVVDVKLSTYPTKSSIGTRAGKHRTTGIFSSFEPKSDQVVKIAPHYEMFLFNALRADLVPIVKKHNGSAKVLMYLASSLTTVATRLDAGSVDNENTEWIVKNHPGWLLKGSNGKPIEGKSWSPKYWPDPGNKEWRAFFVKKVNQLVATTGGHWDGILLDEFLATHTGHTAGYLGGSNTQVNYPSNGAFQNAQLEFLKDVAPRLSVPILPNVDTPVLLPNSGAFNPEFFTDVQRAAGGAEAEVFVLHAPNQDGLLDKEMIEVYLDRARKTPSGKIMILGTPTAELEGHVARTLYTYFTYLLVASPGRSVYWSFKEGNSSVPNFWYKEFDLNLGQPQGEMQTAGALWQREFADATVVVNPNREAAKFAFTRSYFDVAGGALASPFSVGPNSGSLLMKKRLSVLAAPFLHEVK